MTRKQQVHNFSKTFHEIITGTQPPKAKHKATHNLKELAYKFMDDEKSETEKQNWKQRIWTLKQYIDQLTIQIQNQ